MDITLLVNIRLFNQGFELHQRVAQRQNVGFCHASGKALAAIY
jgi:hypothetical protein